MRTFICNTDIGLPDNTVAVKGSEVREDQLGATADSLVERGAIELSNGKGKRLKDSNADELKNKLSEEAAKGEELGNKLKAAHKENEALRDANAEYAALFNLLTDEEKAVLRERASGAATAKKDTPPVDPKRDELEALSRDELREKAKQAGLTPVPGTKAELVEALLKL